MPMHSPSVDSKQHSFRSQFQIFEFHSLANSQKLSDFHLSLKYFVFMNYDQRQRSKITIKPRSEIERRLVNKQLQLIELQNIEKRFKQCYTLNTQWTLYKNCIINTAKYCTNYFQIIPKLTVNPLQNRDLKLKKTLIHIKIY